MYRDIPSFMAKLRQEGELVEIDAEVDPNLEIAEVHRRVIAAGGPALLFKNPTGYDIPVVTNLFCTKLWAERGFFMQGLGLGTSSVARGPVTEVVDVPPRIDRLPMLKSWPDDGGDFVTLPLVYTDNPNDGSHNLGMYRIQRHGPDTTGMHWQIGKGGGFHHHIAQQKGEDLPVTLLVGGPPALVLSAIAPLPENVPELVLASLLQGSRIPMAANPTGHPHRLVSTAEFAFVGHVKPHEVQPEGPFGDHYGYYSLQHDYPVFHVDALCHRKDAVWPATVVGKPRQEDLFIGDFLQELLSPLFPLVMPAVVDLWSYGETGYHALAGAVVRERYRREAMGAAFRVLGEGQLALTKFLWVVDGHVDLRKPKEVLTYLLARFRPETDLYIFSNLSMDTLDYAGPEVNLGSKGIMMGVGDPWRELPTELPSLPGGVTGAALFCPGVLMVSGPSFSEDPDFLDHVLKALPDWPFVVLCDEPERAAASDVRFLWTAFTRFEPAADMRSTGYRVHRHHIVHEGCVGIDARMKPSYPDELFCAPETAKTVTERWGAYFPGGMEMGDSDAGHLDEA